MKPGDVDLACLKRKGKNIVIQVKAGYEIPDLSFIEDIEIYEDDENEQTYPAFANWREQDQLAHGEKKDKRFNPIQI